MIAIDANVAIALIDAQDPHHAWALQFFRDYADFEWHMSVLNFAEVLVRPAALGRLPDADRKLQNLGINVEPVASGDAAALAILRATTGLRMPDAVVLLLAQSHSGRIATTDARLASAAESLGLTALAP